MAREGKIDLNIRERFSGGHNEEMLSGEVTRLAGLPSGLPSHIAQASGASATTRPTAGERRETASVGDTAQEVAMKLGPALVQIKVPDFVYQRGKCIIEVVKSRGFKRFKEIPRLVLQCLRNGRFSNAAYEASRSPDLATAYLSAALSPIHDI